MYRLANLSPETSIVAHGVALYSEPGTRRSSLAYPGVCVLSSGRWLASCRAAPNKSAMREQHVLLSYSDDEGQNWSSPQAPFQPPLVEGKPGLFRCCQLTSLGGTELLAALMWTDYSNPDAEFFNEETQGLLNTRIFLSRSSDSGDTWSEPRLMDTSPFDVPTPLTGPILISNKGEWICQFETNKHYDDSTNEWLHSSVLMFSRDEGATWPEYSLSSLVDEEQIFYWDQRPNLLPDGTLLDVFWTYNNTAARYLNIHARESKDNGRTWSPLWDTEVAGQPAPLVALADGRLIMVYIDREGIPTIKLRTSIDGGRSWPESSEKILYESELASQTRQKDSMQDAWAEMNKFSLGLPTTALLPDGDVLVVFYAGPHTEQTNIRWLRLRIEDL